MITIKPAARKLSLSAPWNSIGHTRLIRISHGLYAKLETQNPTGSIKDRPIQYIIRKALRDGLVHGGTTLVEASSGNTGISVAAIGANLGIPVKIVMPSNMSAERKLMMQKFGAEIIDAPPSDFKAAISLRNKLLDSNHDYWSPMQFENPLNIECHAETTADELLSQMLDHVPASHLAAFISGAGTGGTIMGFHRAIKNRRLSTKCVLVVPADGTMHGIQGIGDGADYLVDRDCVDHIIEISTSDAMARATRLAQDMGLLVGISSGANVLAAERYIKKFNPGQPVATILCDRGERYLSLE